MQCESNGVLEKNDLGDCLECGNLYLAIRVDLYKDKREFVYCDCCGALATMPLWKRLTRLKGDATPVARKVVREPTAPEMPVLPESLVDSIGEYGAARTDGASEVERLRRWGVLIDGIKAYARVQVAAALENAHRA